MANNYAGFQNMLVGGLLPLHQNRHGVGLTDTTGNMDSFIGQN
jgi:hypothetical protein